MTKRSVFLALISFLSLSSPGSALAMGKKPAPSPSASPVPSAAPSPEIIAPPSARPSPRVVTVTDVGTSPIPLPSAALDTQPLQQFKEPLWSVEEGFLVEDRRLIVLWRAEKSLSETTVTRLSGPERTEVQIIPLREGDEQKLREHVAKLSIQLPSRPITTDKSKCVHWMEVETLYGKRFFCKGEDSAGAFDFLERLHQLDKDSK